MDSMVFGLKSSGLIAHRAKVNKGGIRILRSYCQLQRYSQPLAARAQFGMEVALLK